MPPSKPRPPGSSGRATFNEVLFKEVRALRPKILQDFVPAKSSDDEPTRSRNLKELYDEIGNLGTRGEESDPEYNRLSALCLSGGGIRSATFNLGVIQGLARIGLLGQFDYLSSVSGGGYIASWLRAWMRREGTENVLKELGESYQPPNPLAPEPKPIDRLREYSNYLTPKLGLFSADTWAAAAIVVRNLLLNWLIIIPLLGVIVTVPQFCLLVVQSTDFNQAWGFGLLIAAILLALLASGTTFWFRRFVKKPGTPEGYFVVACAVPIYLAALLLATAALGIDLPWKYTSLIASHPAPSTRDSIYLWGFAVLWYIAIPILGWVVSEIRLMTSEKKSATQGKPASPGYEFFALLIAGTVVAALLVFIVKCCLPYFHNHPALYVILALPMLLGLYLLARTFFVAFASLSEGWMGKIRPGASDDADREWWARLSGWVLLFAVGWLALSSLSILGGYLLQRFESKYLAQILTGLGGVSGMVASLLGKSGDTGSGRGSGSKTVSQAKQWALAAAAPLFSISVIVLVARGTSLLGGLVTGQPGVLKIQEHLSRDPNVALSLRDCAWFLAVPVGLALIALLMGRVVNVNRFSLHGVYGNRLVRAYLGASNRDRKPNPFTGFDPQDNLQLHDLWNETKATRPLPLINTTLNLVMSGEKLAWQQRKGESFSMTPFYCGNFHEGYRGSNEYGGPQGISLGTAVTISGAAANPNMGYHSSPAVEFLLALFNARLGAWLGNTNDRGEHTYRFPGPRQALWRLVAELFGLTNAQSRYVNLSDGGHFDNLGVYEAVLRRCRYILVSDAGRDPACAFEDLGNAIRKIRIDFGIPIEFDKKIEILPRDADEKKIGLYCATAIIRYREADGPGARDGQLVYIKPTLKGFGKPVPYDVYSYAESVPDFPHESTTDQWFSESQFESYRALGFHTLEQITVGESVSGFKGFLEQVDNYLRSAPG